MANDSLAQTLARLANAAATKGKTINTTPLTEEQRAAELAKLQGYSKPMAAQVMHQSQVGCPAAPSTAPQSPTPADGRVWLVDTWPHRQAIKASGQAGYDSQARRWYLLDPSVHDRIPAQCLPMAGQQAGAGGQAAQTATTADPAPTKPAAAVSNPETVPVPMVESPTPTLASPPSPPRRSDERDTKPSSPGAAPSNPKSATILPWWPAGARGVPNPVIRSALFGVVRRGRREYLERVKLPAIGGISVTYTGPRLDQADLDVWMQCLELFKAQDIGKRIYFSAREFLQAIGRGPGGGNREWLYKALARLQATAVEIKNGEQVYVGSLIVEGARDERTGMLAVEVNPMLAELFQAASWSRIDWDERQGLGQDHLAKWLHAFYSSHAGPHPIRVRTLQEWSGASTEELWKFRQQLREAMTLINKATGWAWEIDRNDCLHVHKPKQLQNDGP